MGRKSRHYRDESDPLLGLYSSSLAATTSVRTSNPLYTSSTSFVAPDDDPSVRFSPTKSFSYRSQNGNGDDTHVEKNTATKPGYRVHRVSYTAQNHLQVLFQMYGSAFPQVLPFCLANVILTCVVEYLKKKHILDLTFHSSIGHSFMGLLVSFLIVSRSRISYDRFMEFRRHLATTYKSCRELAHLTTVYTFHTQTPQALKWRQEVCYRTILLLRVTMDALLWSSTEREKWEDEYFQYRGGGGGKNGEEEDDDDDDNVSEHFLRFRKLSHGRRSFIDENFRAPITFAHVLRQTIMQHPEALGYKMAVNEYRDLLGLVGQFLDAFHGFRVLVFTPYPFPLVQMTRAFLLVWVYTLPMVLLKEYRLWSSLLIVLLVTFGFVGIEYVSMALDDPTGDDTNDIDEHGMALLVYEDVYLAIYRTDGPQAAFSLQERVLARYKKGRALDCYRDDLKGYTIWEPPHLHYYHHQLPATPEQSVRKGRD